MECRVDTVDSVESLPQINDNSEAYKRPPQCDPERFTPATGAAVHQLSWNTI